MESINSYSSSAASTYSSYSVNSSNNSSKGSVYSPETAGTIANNSGSLFSVTTQSSGIMA